VRAADAMSSFIGMPESLAEVLYELGRAALEQQERQVAELRARTQALLAGAALIASFFGATASIAVA
jgi:hypothetical protein